MTQVQIEIVQEAGVRTVEIIHPGPQAPAGTGGGALPLGGNPGDILMKDGYANGEADWSSTLDGGTFF
jgi:hypothetical protein